MGGRAAAGGMGGGGRVGREAMYAVVYPCTKTHACGEEAAAGEVRQAIATTGAAGVQPCQHACMRGLCRRVGGRERRGGWRDDGRVPSEGGPRLISPASSEPQGQGRAGECAHACHIVASAHACHIVGKHVRQACACVVGGGAGPPVVLEAWRGL
jgi:hypothetical protein